MSNGKFSNQTNASDEVYPKLSNFLELPTTSSTTHPFLLTYLSHFLSGLNYHQKMWCLNRKQLLTSKNYWNKENKNKIKNLRGRGKRHFNTGKKILLRHSYSSYERRGLEAIFDPPKKKKKKKKKKESKEQCYIYNSLQLS